MDALLRDLRFAWRTLRKSPGVTAAAIVALALGIGANTAIFSVVDGVLLKPLSYRAPDQLVRVFTNFGATTTSRFSSSWPEYKDVRDATHTLASVAAYTGGTANLTGEGAPQRLGLLYATRSLLTTLGVEPALGRGFLPEEDSGRGRAVVILDHALWQSRFSGDPQIIGRRITLDGAPYEVIGVMPPGFFFDRRCDAYVPMALVTDGVDVRTSQWLQLVARRAPGVTDAQLRGDLDALSARLRAQYPSDYPPEIHWFLSAERLADVVVGNVRLMLLVLLGAVGCVLLLACANVANLLLARTAARHKEMAVRLALGARRGQIVRQLLTESVLLGIAGGALGLLLAVWCIDALTALAPAGLPRVADVHLDARVLLFTVGVSLVTGVLFGLAPALSASRPDLAGAMKDGSRGSAHGHGRLRKTLVVIEVAVSLLLLVGAGLMVRSFARLRAVDPGFRADHLLTMRMALPVPLGDETDADHDRYVSFFARAQERLRTLPGVRSVGASTILPFAHSNEVYSFNIEGYTPSSPLATTDTNVREVTPGYFETMGIPLVRGRLLAAADGRDAPRAMVVNEAFVRRFWPNGGDVLGKRFQIASSRKQNPWWTIVGVVGDMHSYGLASAPVAEAYFPHQQLRRSSALTMVLRTDGDPAALAVAARAVIAEVDPSQPVFEVATMESLIAGTLAQRRFTMGLMLLFGLVALVLAAVGIYGVMAYTVAQRTREVGIRIALGARPATVLKMVLGDGMRLVAIGLVVGLAAALALGHLVASLLYGVTATDAATYAAIALVLAAVAVIAILIPARRATRVDPMLALRAD